MRSVEETQTVAETHFFLLSFFLRWFYAVGIALAMTYEPTIQATMEWVRRVRGVAALAHYIPITPQYELCPHERLCGGQSSDKSRPFVFFFSVTFAQSVLHLYFFFYLIFFYVVCCICLLFLKEFIYSFFFLHLHLLFFSFVTKSLICYNIFYFGFLSAYKSLTNNTIWYEKWKKKKILDTK